MCIMLLVRIRKDIEKLAKTMKKGNKNDIEIKKAEKREN